MYLIDFKYVDNVLSIVWKQSQFSLSKWMNLTNKFDTFWSFITNKMLLKGHNAVSVRVPQNWF